MRHILTLLILGIFPACLVAQQAPAKKPKEEVEETTPVKKPVKPLRVDDDEAAAGAKQDKQGAPQLSELSREAKDAPPEVRDLYQKLATPYDVVYKKDGSHRKIEPFPYRIADKKTLYRGDEKLRILREGNEGPVEMPFNRAEVDHIDPFEMIAAQVVEAFLARQKDPKTSSVENLQAAQNVLAAVESFHKSELQRDRGGRAAPEEQWADVTGMTRRLLLKVQTDQLQYWVDRRNWDGAIRTVHRLAESYPDAKDHAQFLKPLGRPLLDLVKEKKYKEVHLNMAALKSVFPNIWTDPVVGVPVAVALDNAAKALLGEAENKLREGNKVKALELTNEAENITDKITPASAQVHNLRTKIGGGKVPTLNVGVPPGRLPRSFAPGTAYTHAELLALDLMFESLVKPVYDPHVGQRYYPVLAADAPRQIPLGRQFRLAPEACWSDGKPVRANDVRYTVNALLRGRDDLYPLRPARLPEDSYLVELVLRRGFIDPLALMSFKVLPDPSLHEDMNPARFNQEPFGSGPFKLRSAPPVKGKATPKDADVVFEANPFYRRAAHPEAPYIREIHFFECKDPSIDFKMDQKRVGRMHLLLDIPTRNLKVIESQSNIGVHVVHLKKPRRVYFLAVNHRTKELLKDVNARRALALAINRNAILNSVFRPADGTGKEFHQPLNGPYPPDSWAYNDKVVPVSDEKKAGDPFNIESAKVLANKTALKGATLELKYPDGDEEAKSASEQIVTQVKELGVTLTLKARSPWELRQDVEGDHQYELAYYHYDFPDESYWLLPLFDPKATGAGESNYLGYDQDAELRQKFTQTLEYRDLDKVREFTHDIHKQVHDKMPLIPLWQLDMHLAIHQELMTVPERGDDLDPLHLFNDIDQWKLKSNR